MQKYGGVSRYYCELTEYLKKIPQVSFNLPVVFSDNVYVKSATFPKPISLFGSDKYYFGKRLLTGVCNKVNLANSIFYLINGDYDLFHPTYYNPYFLNYLKNKPFVLTVYDMIHELYPNYIDANDRTKVNKALLVKRCDKVIAISENTKKDISKLLDFPKKSIDVVHLASNLYPLNQPSFMLPSEYILFVGSRWGYKNFDFFLRSISKILQKYKNLYLLCVGGGEFSPKEVKLIKTLGVYSKVKYHFVSDLELGQVYSNARLFVYPSLYEGFGIPILESFNCNCPVVLSNTSCFHEVAGKAGVYFDPSDELGLYNKVLDLLIDDDLCRRHIKLGQNRAKSFSWAKSASETIKVYKSVL